MKEKLLFSLLSMALLPLQSQGSLLKITSKKIFFKENLQQVADKEMEKLINLKRSHKELFEETIKNNYSTTSFVQDIFPNSQYNENLEQQKDNLKKTEYFFFLWCVFAETLPKDHENSIDFISIDCDQYSINYSRDKWKQEGLDKILNKIREENKEENKFYDCSLEFLSKKLTDYKEILCPEASISFHQEFLLHFLSLIIVELFETYSSQEKIILRAVFQETLKHHVLSNTENTESSFGEFLKFSDIFDILIYVGHKIKQFDNETEISTKEERTISKLLEEKFALYRYKKLRESEEEIRKNEECFPEAKESLKKDLLSLRDDGADNKEEQEKINEKIESIFQNENILEVLKIIGVQVFFDIVSLKEEREKYPNIHHIINFIEKKIIKLSSKYQISFHEGAHAFIALQRGVSVRFATCIFDKKDAAGHVNFDLPDSPWAAMLISVAGILGNFMITGKLNKFNKIGASHDFKKIIALSQEISDCFKKINFGDEKEKIANYRTKGLDIFAQSELGKFSLEDFFDSSKIYNKRDVRCNIIAACLVEAYDLLKNSYNDSSGEKKFSFLSEAIFEQGVMIIKNIDKIISLDSKNFSNYKDSLEEDSSEEEEPYSLELFLEYCNNDLKNLDEEEKKIFINYYKNQKKIKMMDMDGLIDIPQNILNNIFKKKKRKFLLLREEPCFSL